MRRFGKLGFLPVILILLLILVTGCGSSGGSRTYNGNGDGTVPTGGGADPAVHEFSGSQCVLAGLDNYAIHGAFYIANQTQSDDYLNVSQLSLTVNSTSSPSGTPVLLKKSLQSSSNAKFQGSKFDYKIRQLNAETFKKHLPMTRSFRKAVTLAPIVGTESNFYIFTSETTIQSRPFVLRKVGDTAYFWVDKSETTPLATMNNILTTYDQTFSNMLPILRNTFGQDTDSDGDSKIYILLSSALRNFAGGYFFSSDKHPRSQQNPYSNEHDTIVLMNYTFSEGIQYNKGTLAHEFQHMINYDRHLARNASSAEYVWLDEAMAELAPFVCGLTNYTDSHIIGYLNDPEIGLTVWNGDQSYGLSALFSRYLYEKYPGSIKKITDSGAVGISNVGNATGVNFNTLVHQFFLTVLLDDTGSSTYEFSTLSLRDTQNGFNGLLSESWDLTRQASFVKNLYPYQLVLVNIAHADSSTILSLTGGYTVGTIITR